MELIGNLPQSDLEELASLTSEILQDNQSVNFVIIGASGFLGSWLSAYFALMQMSGEFRGTLSLLVRDLSKISKLALKMKSPKFRVILIRDLDVNSFDHLTEDRVVVFFAATSTNITLSESKKPFGSTTILAENVISLLPKENLTVIHLSSGAVYSPQARSLKVVPKGFETQNVGSDFYTQEKINMENWLNGQESCGRLKAKNPRLFSFFGPGLQLDRHFAIGEFMASGKSLNEIIIRGNPENLRSYLYPTDAIWQLLLQTKSGGPSHTQVGSAQSTTIAEAGFEIASMYGVKFIISERHTEEIDHYVPEDVPTFEIVNFSEGLNRWRRWLNYSQEN